MSLAAEALIEAMAALGMDARVVDEDADYGVDVLSVDAHGRAIALQVKSRATVSDAQLSRLPPADEQWRDEAPLLRVMVADRLLASGREKLNSLGWSWLDLRGRLRLVGPGVHIDTDVPAFSSRPGRTRALSGVAGLEVACALLLSDEPDVSVRSLARALGRAPSTVSDVLKALRAEDLLAGSGEIAIPELFWEVAAGWRDVLSVEAAVQVPDASLDKALRLGLRDAESTPGWALTDTMAAAAYGAPVVAAADHPLDFYVPDKVTFRRARALLPSHDSAPAATVRVAPVPAVCARRVDEKNQRWPLAHPLFVALDLARDAGRGREILEQWRPEAWRRVW